MMGGVHTDIDGATPLDGLYAAGETACVSINGANRLGSNSLPECLVFGARAGQGGRGVRRRPPGPAPASIEAQAADEVRRIERDLLGTGPGDGGRLGDPRPRCSDDGGVGRHLPHRDPRWPRASTRCASCRSGRATIGVADTSRIVQHRAASPPWSWPTCSTSPSACSQSGLQREESRGAHQRTDFPDRDDERFLAHQLVHRNADGTPRVERLPVTITRWPPGERVYGR